MSNLIYIAGYGRSGSTLLERLLSMHDQIIGLGEIAYIYDKNYADQLWKRASEHHLWRSLMDAIRISGDGLITASYLQYKNEALPWCLLRRLRCDKEYSVIIQKTLNEIDNKMPQNIKYIIDSSKTARARFGRPFCLRQSTNKEIKIIHLVRDPQGCVASLRKGSNNGMEGLAPTFKTFSVARVYIGWLLSNIAPILYKIRYGRQCVMVIFYEDLCNTTENTLKKIGDFLDIDVTHIINALVRNEEIPPAPQFAGNRLRHSKKLRLAPQPTQVNPNSVLEIIWHRIVGVPMMRLLRKL